MILYHAKLPGFGKGYLGVDVFFVISGYLITQLVTTALGRGDFSLAEFYRRRALRLLPAALVTLLVVALLALWLLPRGDVLALRAQMLGAASYSVNFVLWQQGGYFGGDSALRPLLHFWSLAVEEQFYLLLPPMLMLLAPRRWLWALGLVTAASFGLWMWAGDADWAFFLLPTRAWELALGGALLLSLGPAGLPPLPLLNAGAPARVLGWVGDRSYSLYLVHWPLFSLLAQVWMGRGADAAPLWLRLAIIGMSFVAAEMLYRGVERPLRRPERFTPRQSWAAVLGGTTLALLVAWVLPALSATDAEAAEYRQPNRGLSERCAYTDGFTPLPECQSGEAPRVLLWGDSHAMQWASGLEASGAVAFVQATRVQCAPLLGAAPFIAERAQPLDWAESCQRFNGDVLRYLAATPSIEVVVLGSVFWRYVQPGLMLVDEDGRAVPAGEAQALRALKLSVDSIRALGRRAIVLAPPPNFGFDAARCQERRRSGKPVLGVSADCGIETAAYLRERAPVRRYLDLAGRFVPVVQVEQLICDPVRCRSSLDGVVLYADEGHLSRVGAAALGRRNALADLVLRVSY